jgi:hypothetical protein
MVRPFQLALLLPALAVGTLHAQNVPPPLAVPSPAGVTPADGAAATARTTPAPQRALRAISPEVAAQLAASRPKFTPVAPPPPPKPEEEMPDLRETDKPKNTIVRLPKFVVQEPKSPIFREQDIHTKQGLANLAMRRYLTETDRALNRFRLPLFSTFSTNGGSGSNEDRALAMYFEDERLKEMADAADRTNMVMKSDAAAGAKMKDVNQQTFMRWSDIGWQKK